MASNRKQTVRTLEAQGPAGRAGDAPPIEQLAGADEIAARVDALARDIAADLGPEFLMAVVLKGGFVFAADLVRALSLEGAAPEVGFLALSSYGGATESSGEVRMLGEMLGDVSGRPVLLVDDILDTGLTLMRARDLLLARGAAGVRLCVLADKPARRTVELAPDYVGFSVPDRFLVGYGIDFAERYRELPYLGMLPADEEG